MFFILVGIIHGETIWHRNNLELNCHYLNILYNNKNMKKLKCCTLVDLKENDLEFALQIGMTMRDCFVNSVS